MRSSRGGRRTPRRSIAARWRRGSTSVDASPLCKTGLDAMMTADNGVITAWQSYLGNLAMVKGGGLEKYWTESEVYRCKGGNQQLARRLAAAIGSERVLTSAPVTQVQVNDRLARVTLASGRVLEAEHVLLTAPPSVWNRIAFDPLLPGDADAADGIEREVPDRAEEPVLAQCRASRPIRSPTVRST